MDTGGIGLEDKDTPVAISEATESQAEFAILAANLILFVTDGREGVTMLDMQIADLLRPHQKKVVLVVNKIDHPENQNQALEMSQLGMGDPHAVSAEHKLGIDELEDHISNGWVRSPLPMFKVSTNPSPSDGTLPHLMWGPTNAGSPRFRNHCSSETPSSSPMHRGTIPRYHRNHTRIHGPQGRCMECPPIRHCRTAPEEKGGFVG